MKKFTLIFFAIVISVTLILPTLDAKKKSRKLNDEGIPIVEKNVCSNLCSGNETIYVYEGIADEESCEKIGGEMYSHQGWELIIVCKMIHPKRCKQQDGKLGEFHFPFLSKNYVHLGCTTDMKPEDCREELRKIYAEKEIPNKYFMNNIGCLTH